MGDLRLLDHGHSIVVDLAHCTTMALEDLVRKIVRDVEESADAMRASAKRTAEVLDREAREREEEYVARFAHETETLCAKEKASADERARRDAQMVLEKERRRLLDGVFASVEEEMTGVDADTYRAFVRAELVRIASDLSTLHTFYAPACYSAIVEEEVRAAGGTARVGVRDDVRNGFVAVGDVCEYDLRFDRLVLQVKRACEPEVANMLFMS